MTSDIRRLTNPTLKICGRIDDPSAIASSRCPGWSWLGGVFALMRCSRRRKEWRANNERSNSLALAISSEILRRKNQDVNFNWLNFSDTSNSFKVLLVFGRSDQQSEIIARVASKLGWSVSQARNAEEAQELFRSELHDLVIVDRRGGGNATTNVKGFDADETCRSLLELCESKKCNIVALVRKSFFTAPQTEEVVVLHLLNMGYSRALMECSHEGILMNELIGIYANESQTPKSQLTAAQLLYVAVDRCRDIVHVTNDQHVVQFANRASEKMLGYKQEELLGRSIQEFVTNDNFEVMDQQLQRGREFEGNVSWRRKEKGSIGISCRIVPVNVPSSKTLNYVYLYDSTTKFESITSSASLHHLSSRGSVPSFGRPSYDLRLSKPRKSIIAKLHNLPLEAPITKVITLLSNAALDSDSPEVSEQIDRAIELLKKTELYSPRMRDGSFAESDPVVKDLLEALIHVNNVPHNDARNSTSTSFKTSSVILKALNSTQFQANAKLLKSPEYSQELEELLETCFNWDFDIFKLETITNKRPLFYLGMRLMNHYRVAERLECDEKILQNWLTVIEANYNADVTYHNSTHATDVMQSVARFMRAERLQMILDPLDAVVALIAAAAHDVGHPGKSSQFLCNASDKLAVLYNDLTVLESHHSALTFKVSLSDDRVNIFKNVNSDTYRLLRHNVIDMILATEMTKHFEHLARFVNVCSNKINEDFADNEVFDDDISNPGTFLLPENVTLTKRIMIKCADVSNPTRPFRLYVEWTKRIAEEYFDQTDEEKKKKLPVVMPQFDRVSCSVPKSQIGFIDFIINDMMEAWDGFIDMPEIISNLKENYEKWRELNEQGVTTLEEIEKLQETPELQLFKKGDSL